MGQRRLLMMGKDVTFPIVKGQGIVLWRNYSALGIMLDEFIAKGEEALIKFMEYMQEDGKVNFVRAEEGGLWTMRQYPVGDTLSIYVRMKDTEVHSQKYGSYIAWSTLAVSNKIADFQYPSHKISMRCGYCGKDTSDVDMEYLAGTDHLECALKDEIAIMNGTTC
jgi:hypothetical protein